MNEFITTKMKMTSFYQPMILMCILNGITDNKDIAILCNQYDSSFTAENYSKKLKIYPKQVLKKHNMATLNKNVWALNDDVNVDNKDELIQLLESKLNNFKNR